MAFIRKIEVRHDAITAQKLAELIPFYVLEDPSECWVSRRSQWKDLRWQLDAKFASVNWAFRLPDGSLLTDPQHASLLDELRRLFWSFFCNTDSHPAIALTTATAIFGRLRELTRWMFFRAYQSVADLDANALIDFIDDLKAEAVARENLNAAEAEADAEADAFVDAADEVAAREGGPSEGVEDLEEGLDDEDSDPLWDDELAQGLIDSEIWVQLRDDRSIFGRLYNSLRLWDHIYSRRSLFQGRFVFMELDPFGGRSAYKIAKEKAAAAYALIPPLPDEVAIPAMNAANAWLYWRADDICLLAEKGSEIVSRCSRYRGDLRLSECDAKFLLAFQFSVDPVSSKPWREPLDVVQRKGFYLFPSFDINRLVTQMRGACALVLHSETGLRPEELEKTPAKVREGETLRPPYYFTPTESGLNQLWYMQSLISKAQPVPVLTSWMLGSTPSGSSYTPAPVRAIDVLVRLLEPWRKLSGDPEVASMLFVHSLGPNFPTAPKNIYASSSALIGRAQRAFITQCVDLSKLPDRSKRDENLIEYRQTAGACIYPSQWRKTFAMYTVRVDSSMIPEVAQQFHHMSVAMTESHYIGTNIELLKERDSQRSRATASFMLECVRGSTPTAGRTSKLIYEYKDEILAVVGDARGVAAIAVLAQWCERRGVRVFPSASGHCFVGLWPKDAECHKAAGTGHWSNTAPNYEYRNPSACVGCKCFGIDVSHAPFWNKRYVENKVFVIKANRLGLVGGTLIAKERAKQSASVLNVLRIELPVLDTAGEEETDGS